MTMTIAQTLSQARAIAAPARIVVVDDHGIVRYGYSQLIDQEPGLLVCGMAGDEISGFELIKVKRPDVAIIDLSLKNGDGLDLVKSVAKQLPPVRLLVVSAHDEHLFAHRSLAAGAHGFINKQEAPSMLIDGIQALLAGDYYFSESVKKTLLDSRLGRRSTARAGVRSLTNRELQVFEQVGNGRSTRQIAQSLSLSVKTIERHKENIKQKLGIDHATQLVQHATQWVLGKEESTDQTSS